MIVDDEMVLQRAENNGEKGGQKIYEKRCNGPATTTTTPLVCGGFVPSAAVVRSASMQLAEFSSLTAENGSYYKQPMYFKTEGVNAGPMTSFE